MKTGLLTLFRGDGRLLQAAALAKAVTALSGECQLIHYAPPREAEAPSRRAAREEAARRERAQRFARGRLPLSGHRFESLEELRSAELPYDLLLCAGSRPRGPLDPALLGDFTQRRRAAYGLHLHGASLSEDLRRELAGQMAAFTHLSVQTEAERRLLRERTGRDAAVVLDPLLLLTAEEWSALGAKVQTPPAYILYQASGDPGALGPYLRRLTAETGLPVICLGEGERPSHIRVRTLHDAGPAEAVTLLQKASYVLTDSFWATALAIVFQRPFFTALPAGKRCLRRTALLERLGLSDRILGRGDAAGPLDPIDWAETGQKLEEQRAYSLGQLEAALLDRPAEAPVEEERGVRLAPRALCTGCTACAAICPRDAIRMVRDREGFDYPEIDPALCDGCGLCAERCPAGRSRETRHLPAAFAAWNRDEAARKDSTAGGVFSALADFVLEGGGVVFGAAMDARQRLRHVVCFSKEELWRLRGAKYVQSRMDGVFRIVRECLDSRQVLFCGTPCQVEGLYRFLGGRPENLITCDLVCRGAPSPGVWEDTVRLTEERKKKSIQAVRFSNKVTGWTDQHLTLVYDNGTVDSLPFRRTGYGRACLRGLTLRPACYDCPYASMARPGDFTLGDFRGLRPEELPEQQSRGVSLLLVNTPHGSHIFDQLPLGRQALPPERAIAGDPALSAPILCPPERSAFFAAYALEPFPAVRKRYLRQPPLASGLLKGKKGGGKGK